MSHFCALVVTTPNYPFSPSYSVEKYYEGNDVPEYCVGEVPETHKLDFMFHYCGIDQQEWLGKFFKKVSRRKAMREIVQWFKNGQVSLRYLHYQASKLFPEEYIKFVNENVTFNREFADLYKEKGDDWNGNNWRMNEEGKWMRYSTYNPNSKWDWFEVGGRWNKYIKTNSGECVNTCKLGEIDWTDYAPEDYESTPQKDWRGNDYYPLKEGVKEHFTKSDLPLALVVDGEWHEQAEMHSFGSTSDDKPEQEWQEEFFGIINNISADSDVILIDFHI